MSDIFNKISEKASLLEENDIEWIMPELMTLYSERINVLARRAYGAEGGKVAKDAFRATAEDTLRNGLNTFLFRMQHWRNGRDINTYLLTCLKRLSDRIFWDQSGAKKSQSLICPACKDSGQKVLLVSESNLWRCATCTEESNRLADELKKSKDSEKIALRAKLQLHKVFSLHSRKGYRCGDIACNRFIPETLNGRYGIECPYLDCDFFGTLEELKPMCHPATLTIKHMLSLNDEISDNDSKTSFQDLLKSNEISADEKLAFKQIFEKEYSILVSVIEQQINGVKRSNYNATKTQKLLMYEAFKLMSQKSPDEMVSYLVHLKQNADSPIQARIFQEYIGLIEDALPFSIVKGGEEIEIVSVSDPNLGLFLGKSVFEAIVKEDGVIPNNTIETYVGSREFKNFGPCFIGKLIDVIDKESGKSVLDKVSSYYFSQINTSIPVGTKVIVSHYRIPSHYEMMGLVFLQRVRRHLVDKIYFRLHGKKRVPGTKG